jgi:hypothetical protein
MRSQEDSQIVTYHVDSGKFVCDCKYYSVHCICSHIVACAEINDKLKAFLKWHSDNGKRTNKYKQSTYNLNLRGVGQKGNVPRRRRVAHQSKDKTDPFSSSDAIPESCAQLENHERQFILKHLHGTQIRKCYGCGLSIRTPPSVPPPPQDFVLAAKVQFSFSHPKTGLLVIKRDWKHFHFKRACVESRLDLGVHVCNLIKNKLTEIHLDNLKKEFEIY